jgi:hypothetical protein
VAEVGWSAAVHFALTLGRCFRAPTFAADPTISLQQANFRTLPTGTAHHPSEHQEYVYVGLQKESPIVTYGPVNDAMYAAELELLREWRDIVHGWEHLQ